MKGKKVMFMKKWLKVIGVIVGGIIVLGIVFFAIDYNRVQKQAKPIFCINVATYRDGGTKEYYGLGYKVIDFHTLEGFDDIKIGTWLMNYNDFNGEMKVYEEKFEEQLQKNDYNIENDRFKAIIKEISEYNEITTILVKGLESNDINYRGEFEFSVHNDTKILWIDPYSIKSSYTAIDLSNLKEGQNVSITSIGEVLESYPAKLTKVTEVIVLEEKL